MRNLASIQPVYQPARPPRTSPVKFARLRRRLEASEATMPAHELARVLEATVEHPDFRSNPRPGLGPSFPSVHLGKCASRKVAVVVTTPKRPNQTDEVACPLLPTSGRRIPLPLAVARSSKNTVEFSASRRIVHVRGHCQIEIPATSYFQPLSENGASRLARQSCTAARVSRETAQVYLRAAWAACCKALGTKTPMAGSLGLLTQAARSDPTLTAFSFDTEKTPAR